jgi:hypothetical protein
MTTPQPQQHTSLPIKKTIDRCSHGITNKHCNDEISWFFCKLCQNFETKLSCFFQSQDKFYWKRKAISIPEKKALSIDTI